MKLMVPGVRSSVNLQTFQHIYHIKAHATELTCADQLDIDNILKHTVHLNSQIAASY